MKTSKVPTAVDFCNQQKLDEMVQKQTIKENEVLQEIAESKAIGGIEQYFENNSNEDVFIMGNQDIRDPTNNTWHERDIIAINLSRG